MPNKQHPSLKRPETKISSRKAELSSRHNKVLSKKNPSSLKRVRMLLTRKLKPELRLSPELSSRLQKRRKSQRKKEKNVLTRRLLKKLRPEKLLTMKQSLDPELNSLLRQPKTKPDLEDFMRREKLPLLTSKPKPLESTKLKELPLEPHLLQEDQ